MLHPSLAIAALASLCTSAAAYSFTITDTPQQCQNLSLSITGSGTPPYSALVLPYGASTLPNNIEVRKIQDQAFADGATSVSFQLAYPENSQFIVVVSNLPFPFTLFSPIVHSSLSVEWTVQRARQLL